MDLCRLRGFAVEADEPGSHIADRAVKLSTSMTDEPDTESDDPVLMFNLAHDVLVTFRADGSCTLARCEDEETSVRLDPKAQLLLLDALCDVFAFESPLSSIVTKREMNDHEVDTETPTGYIDLADMPSLDNVLPEDPDV